MEFRREEQSEATLARDVAPEKRGIAARRGRSPLLRMWVYVRPLAGLVVIVVLLTLALSGGRFARAYLMKPILDDVLLPHQAHSLDSYTPAWLRALPFVGRGDPMNSITSSRSGET